MAMGDSITTREMCLGNLRLKGSQFQQLFEILMYDQFGTAYKRRVEWRDVPVVDTHASNIADESF